MVDTRWQKMRGPLARAGASLVQPLRSAAPWRAFSLGDTIPHKHDPQAEVQHHEAVADMANPEGHTGDDNAWGEVAVVAELPEFVRKRRVRGPSAHRVRACLLHPLCELAGALLLRLAVVTCGQGQCMHVRPVSAGLFICFSCGGRQRRPSSTRPAEPRRSRATRCRPAGSARPGRSPLACSPSALLLTALPPQLLLLV